MTRGEDLLQDALKQLDGWRTDATHMSRVLHLDESQHASLTEWIKIYADAFEQRPDIHRSDGQTRIAVAGTDGVTLSEVNFAARVEDAYQHITGSGSRDPEANPHAETPTGALRAWWYRRRQQSL
ncbi:MAG: 4a-hydroxytetrahydrobiopterin dehydratase [Stackebrandtia sp.]